jgi:hypothetical protein
MSSRRRGLRIGVTSAIVLAASLLGLVSGAGVAHASATACESGTASFWNTFPTGGTECMAVNGGGLYVSTMVGYATQKTHYANAVYTYHVEVVGPNGHICNSPTVTSTLRSDGYYESAADCVYGPYGNVRAGNYCTIVWALYNGSNSYWQNMAESCVNVHS